ncbi:hypothetical protein C8R45DRAFT_1167325, partial [Mycena sanguinolenta]
CTSRESAQFVIQIPAIVILNAVFVLPGGIITLLSAFTGRIYMIAQLPIQRQMSSARSPMLSHFAAAICGLSSSMTISTSIEYCQLPFERIELKTHSFGSQQFFHSVRDLVLEFEALDFHEIRHFGRPILGSPWILSCLWRRITLWSRQCRIFAFGGTGVHICDFMVANNLECVVEYLDIEQEQKPTQTGIPPAYWPASGEIRGENLSAKYSADGGGDFAQYIFLFRSSLPLDFHFCVRELALREANALEHARGLPVPAVQGVVEGGREIGVVMSYEGIPIGDLDQATPEQSRCMPVAYTTMTSEEATFWLVSKALLP